ncbi:hypothetical protein P7C70_g5255, partial [Phenoliferia sp. Uapishka_3]
MSLSMDLIPSILDAVESLPAELASTTFLSLSRVSHSWSHQSLFRLYRAPFIPHPTLSIVQSLFETLSSHSYLANAVRTLHLGHWTARLASISPLFRRKISKWVLDILRVCPRLRSLNFPGVTRRDMAELEEVLGGLSEIEELVFREGVTQADPWALHLDAEIQDELASPKWQMETLRRMLGEWPKLRKFTLGAVPVMSTNSPGERSWKVELESFTLDLKSHVELPKGMVDCMLYGSSESLRHLELNEHQLHRGERHSAHDAGTSCLLEKYGSTLISLRTNQRNQHAFSNLPSVIAKHCTNLVSLDLGSQIFASPTVFTIFSRLSFLRHLELRSVEYVNIDAEGGGVVLFDAELVAVELLKFQALNTVVLGERGRHWKPWDEARVWDEKVCRGLAAKMQEGGVQIIVHDVCPLEEVSLLIVSDTERSNLTHASSLY